MPSGTRHGSGRSAQRRGRKERRSCGSTHCGSRRAVTAPADDTAAALTVPAELRPAAPTAMELAVVAPAVTAPDVDKLFGVIENTLLEVIDEHVRPPVLTPALVTAPETETAPANSAFAVTPAAVIVPEADNDALDRVPDAVREPTVAVPLTRAVADETSPGTDRRAASIPAAARTGFLNRPCQLMYRRTSSARTYRNRPCP